MASETVDSKFSLKSSTITISSVVYTMNVPNFFILPEYDGTEFEVESPPFEFANATWQLKFFGILYRIKGIRSFEVYLVNMTSENEEQAIICTIDLLDAYGEIYDSSRIAFVLDEVDEDELYFHRFYSDKPSYDRRDTLTLIIHLVSDSSFKVPAATDRDFDILSQDFKKLFLNGKNHDLTLRVKNTEIRVHRDILMARSQVFEAMLTHDMKEKNKGVIDVPDCDPQAMEQFLLYVYSGKVGDMNHDNALHLYYVADKYQMLPLKEECCEFIKKSLSPSIICDVVKLALEHSDNDLLECASEYFVNHTCEIFPTVKWLSFMKTNTVAANELLIRTTKK